jgi:L-fuculose-phosphate aldolase
VKENNVVQFSSDQMRSPSYTIAPIGIVHSELTRLEGADAGDEDAPPGWRFIGGRARLQASRLAMNSSVLAWLHAAQRDVLQVHPRGDLNRP